MRLLLVESDRQLADNIRLGLEEERHSVTLCHDGSTGLRAAQLQNFDAIVLEVETPFMDGLEVTRRLRLEKIDTPVILVGTCGTSRDVVRGFDAGADDHLVKPFSFEVLLARLRARTRSGASHALLRLADLTMDLDSREVRRGRKAVTLSRTEFSLLECLLRNAGRVVEREHLIASAWGNKKISRNNLEVFIKSLRDKIDRPGYRKIIQTERGIGYCLKEQGV